MCLSQAEEGVKTVASSKASGRTVSGDKCPNFIEFRSDLPTSAVGSILRRRRSHPAASQALNQSACIARVGGRNSWQFD